MRTFAFFTRDTEYGIRMHNLNTCFWESRMAQDKKKTKTKNNTQKFACLAQQPPKCSAGN